MPIYRASANILTDFFLGTEPALASTTEASIVNETALSPSNSFAMMSGKELSTDTNLQIVSENSLLAVTGPLGVSDGTDSGLSFADEVSIYVVRKGDSIAQVAQMFGISTNTILWANDMKKGDPISEGDILLIFPVSGIEHEVKSGETLKGISSKYNVDSIEVARFNGILELSPLKVGDKLFIPDAEKTDISTQQKTTTSNTTKNSSNVSSSSKNVLNGYFINPVPGARRSQGLHDKYAVDLAIPTGTPIKASASGTVIFAKQGYNGGFGGLVILQHPNGVQTYYAHQSRILAKSGAKVSQGETIGYVGSTGRSTGPHLHFEVRGAKNPGVDGSWAK